jgi:Ca2+-binding EF-hand superfamily protein
VCKAHGLERLITYVKLVCSCLTICVVEEFIMELDPNHDGEITEEEFMLVMKYIQQRTSTQFPPINQS